MGEDAPFLTGYRVLDLTWVGPGPFCTRLLGDLGFDVIKVAQVTPSREVRARPQVPMMFHRPGSSPPEYGFRNARSVALNLRHPAGRHVFLRLVKEADVMIEGFRPGVAARLGIDYPALRGVNPRLIYVSVSGYGQTGPYRELPGHDINYLAVAGFVHTTGRAGGKPSLPATMVADYAAGGMAAALHVLAALLRRQHTGQGAYCDVSVTDAAFELCWILVDTFLATGVEPRRGRTITSGFWPWYDVYPCQDGKLLAVAAIEPHFYQALCRALGREDLTSAQWELGRRQEVRQAFREAFASQPRQYWLERLARAGTCVSPVHSIAEAVEDPQLRQRGMVWEVSHPLRGQVRVCGSLWHLDGRRPSVRRWALAPGQHTDEVLAEHGYSREEIERLREEGVVA